MVAAALVMLSSSKHSVPAIAAEAPSPAPAAATVHIVNFAFSPATITVVPGTVVTFVNDDAEPHTATMLRPAPHDKAAAADLGAFDSGGLDTGDRWTHAFAKPGTYRYFCALHPMMLGVVIVKGTHA